MSQNVSDYTSPFNFSIADHIPENYQNPLNVAISKSIFDRFLTDAETSRVIGTVGRPNTSSTTNNQVVEDSVFAQAYQLQPVVEAKAGSETLYYNYQDVLSALTQLGVDPETVHKWQATEAFNFALPIDLDKFINYTNYYWVSTATPDYITIRNPQTVLQMQVAQQVANYTQLYSSGDTSRAALWPTIAEGLDYINSYVAETHRISISGLDVALADTIHAPYVATTRSDRSDLILTNGWQSDNKWVHRMHVTDITNVTRATMPILEYSNLLQLTNWTYTTSQWMYRRSTATKFVTTSAQPTDAEIFNRFPLVGADAAADTFVVAGDQTQLFAVGKQFTIEESSIYNGYWTATAVTFDGTNTTISVKENVIVGTVNGNAVPFTVTSQGDPWVSFFEQWCFVRNNPSLPSLPPANQITVSEASFVATAGQTIFDLPPELQYVVGSNTIDVYIDGLRQYGNYDETSSTSITFNFPLEAGQQVVFVPAARTANDVRRMNVAVRIYQINGSRVVQNECLVVYRKTQQYKTETNQYPLFDLVNLDGTSKFESSSLITFAESSSAPINSTIGKRIVVDTATKDYTMTIDVVDGELKGYIYNGEVTTVWTTAGVVAPQLIDKNGNLATSGVWSIPEQFSSNLDHQVRATLKFSELFAHFRSIASSQPLLESSVYGSVDSLSGYHLLNTVNYGLGGTIREHNDSFDTLVSTVISTDHSYTDVIAFARDQYRELMVEYYARVETALVETFAAHDPASIANLVDFVSQLTISNIETDSLLYKLYGDSTTGLKYDSVTNWIATTPFFGWKTPSAPQTLVDQKRNIFEVIHHDGHSVIDELDFSSFGKMVTSIVYKLNLYNSTKTSTISANLKVGQVAYDATSNTLYRLNVVGVSVQPPLLAPYPNGVYWVSLGDMKLYQKVDGDWSLVGSSLDPAWQAIDLQSIVLAAIVNIETQLYEGAVKVVQKTSPLQNVLMDANKSYRQSAFEAYAARENITLPYQGDYSATDPFTWYYASIDPALIRHPSSATLQWGARAYHINELNFGTKYPHLQPWVLQGYTSQPVWWAAEYAGTTRRWSTFMWTNILSGIVPTGKALPNGQISTGAAGEVVTWNFVSVNTTNQTTTDGYGPDDLLPTYWVPISSADNIPGIADQVFLNCNYSLLTGIATNWYPFGTFGPVEQQWVDSVDYFYDLLVAEFLIRPSQLVHDTFGEEYINVGGLDIDKRTNLVYSHANAVFHGDVDSNGNLLLIDGINQWYTQFFRYINIDTNANSYKDLWTQWKSHLSYNVGAYVIDNTLSISSAQIDLSESDYSVASKKNKHVRDVWIDALYVNVAQVGTLSEMPKGAGRDWKFNVFVNCPISRTISYYDVYKAAVTTNQATGVFTIGNGKTLSGYGWTVGQPVVFDTGVGGALPTNLDNMTYYFLIPITDTTFQIADSADHAAAGIPIALESGQSGVCYVGELQSTFYALSQQNAKGLWRHFKVSSNELSFASSMQVTGIQNLIDVIDGYQAYLLGAGFRFNLSDAIEYDATNNRQLNWQYEIERVINTMYMYAASGSTNLKAAIGTLDVNPFRNYLWIYHPQGVVSSFDSQDATQAQYRAFMYDNTGATISMKDYHVLREDQQTMFAVVSPITFVDQIATNDFPTIQYLPNNFGGAHVFFDDYEHIVVFNDYAISGDLIWDQFLGIQVPRVQVYFEKQVGTPKRPNIGGYVLGTNGSMQQNLEYTVSNITNYYDTFTVNENSDFIGYARALLGYRENVKYMQEIGATPKSQFLFYKGLIQNKGTLGSITAFTNASSLNAADVDEFWAYKLFEFGENRTKASYLLNMQPSDTVLSQMKMEFVIDGETADATFTSITNSDTKRWLEYPNQRTSITANSNVSFEMKVAGVDEITLLPAKGFLTNWYYTHAAADHVEILLDATQRATINNISSEQITLPFYYPMGVDALVVYLNGTLTTNFVELSSNRISVPGSLDGTVIVGYARVTLKEGTHYTRINNRIVQFIGDPTVYGRLDLIRYVADAERSVPISLLDKVSQTTVVDMTTWDPANGHYTDEVALTVDVFSNTDPAVYNTIPDQTRLDAAHYWNAPEQGSVWMDTSSYRFVPYNDAIAQDTETRLLNWARMESWSTPTAYVWIGTAVAPSSWTDGTPYQQVFQRTRATGTITFNNNVGTITGLTLADQTEVIFVGSTSPLADKTIYVLSVTTGGFHILDQSGNVITGIANGSTWTVMSASFDENWTTVQNLSSVIECAEIGSATNIPSGLPANTEYSMYLDGAFVQDGYTNVDGTVDLEADTVTAIAVRPFATQITLYNKTGVVDGLPTTKPDAFELTGETLQQYVTTPYVVTTVYNEASNQPTQYYYYWVTGSSVTVGAGYLTNQVQSFVNVFTKPYVVFSKPVLRNDTYALSQLIAIGISGLVSDANRYVLRLVRDDTLRDRTYVDSDGNLLRPIHSEWKLFRQNQDSAVDRIMWDKMVSAIIGYYVADTTIDYTTPVPALDRVAYDKLNGTNTRCGMDVGQAFCDGAQAKVTIMAELNNPNTDFTPNDVDLFLATHSMDTDSDTVGFLNDLYMTFAPARVNQIFFAVMMDALSIVGANYSTGLIKTSGIAVSSSMPLNVNGALDG